MKTFLSFGSFNKAFDNDFSNACASCSFQPGKTTLKWGHDATQDTQRYVDVRLFDDTPFYLN